LKNDGGSIDLLEVVNEARTRNLGFPLLISVPGFAPAPGRSN